MTDSYTNWSIPERIAGIFFQDITGVFRAYSNSKDGAPLQIYLTA